MKGIKTPPPAISPCSRQSLHQQLRSNTGQTKPHSHQQPTHTHRPPIPPAPSPTLPIPPPALHPAMPPAQTQPHPPPILTSPTLHSATKATIENPTCSPRHSDSTMSVHPPAPKLSKSMCPQYQERSHLFHNTAIQELHNYGKSPDHPMAWQVQHEQRFGKDNLQQTYTTEHTFPHIILLLFKSTYLQSNELSPLFHAYPRAGLLHHEWLQVHNFPFEHLRLPNPNWKTQDTIDDNRVDLRLACLLHFNGDLAAVHRYIGGEHVSAH